jgi:hypothetical protein
MILEKIIFFRSRGGTAEYGVKGTQTEPDVTEDHRELIFCSALFLYLDETFIERLSA